MDGGEGGGVALTPQVRLDGAGHTVGARQARAADKIHQAFAFGWGFSTSAAKGISRRRICEAERSQASVSARWASS